MPLYCICPMALQVKTQSERNSQVRKSEAYRKLFLERIVFDLLLR